MAILVSLPQIPAKSSSVQLYRLSVDGTRDLGFMTPNAIVTYVGLNVSSELDTDQGGY